MFRKIIIATLIVPIFALVGCASSLGYNPGYALTSGISPISNGQAALVMTDAQQNQMYSGHPTSYTGSATTLSVPIGQVAREIGLTIIRSSFTGGANLALSAENGKYNINVSVQDVSYKYDQLSNLGFAITPKVTLSVHAIVTSPSGQQLFDKTYTKTDYTAGTYVASLQPAEKINQGFHQALSEIFKEMMNDIKAAETNRSS